MTLKSVLEAHSDGVIAIAVWKHLSETRTGVSAGVGGAFTAPSERYGKIESTASREIIRLLNIAKDE